MNFRKNSISIAFALTTISAPAMVLSQTSTTEERLQRAEQRILELEQQPQEDICLLYTSPSPRDRG